MKSDGQLYQRLHKGELQPLPPPSNAQPDCAPIPAKKGETNEQLLILAVIVLLISENTKGNLPIIIALFYLLVS